jgi:signal peptidase I
MRPPRNQLAGIPVSQPQPAYAPDSLPSTSMERATMAMKMTAPAKQQGKAGSRLWQFLRTPAIALLLVVILRLAVFDVVQVSGKSMMPTLQPMDSLISSKIIYKLQNPQRYDIILLDAPDRDGHFIKRIIGLPNEHIEIADGLVFINGELLSEEYLENIYTEGNLNTVIPDGYYFVMGDNRPASLDSRADTISSIAEESIKGKAILRFFPFNSIGTVK